MTHSPLEGTQILEEEKLRDMIDPLKMKDPNSMFKGKKSKGIGTGEDDSVGTNMHSYPFVMHFVLEKS